VGEPEKGAEERRPGVPLHRGEEDVVAGHVAVQDVVVWGRKELPSVPEAGTINKTLYRN
jgi:hypothetical protein